MEMTAAHNQHTHSAATWLMTGTALAAGAVILAPYVLPLVGIGTAAGAVDAMTAIHGVAAGAGGSGLAGMLNGAMGAIPLIGETLAEGGVKTAIASGIFGLGGVLLNRYSEKHEDGKRHIRWGKVIGTAALITSALIALPTVLTGISAGVVFLGSLAGAEVGKAAIAAMTSSFGAANGKNLASAAALALPHLLTCGVAAAPPLLAAGLNHIGSGDKKELTLQQKPAAPSLPATGSVTALITLDKPTAANLPVNGIVTLRDPSGQPLTLDKLKAVHTKKLHFFVIDSSLKDYHHIHPTPTDMPGQYAFSFTPKTSNNYSGWADVTIAQDNKNYRVKADMPAQTSRNLPPSVMMNSRAEAKNAGLTFEWKTDKPLAKNASSMVEITVKDAQGKPVTDLEPVLGAYAHLVGFNADGKTIIHSHPMGAEPDSETAHGGPSLRFHVQPEAAGNTQFYLQVKEHGQDVFAPFGQMIKQSEKATDRVMVYSGISGDQGIGLSAAR